ncbi:MAG TPA: N-acetylmuramoyl-L-alanine amidase, partial [candidate division Zixibacteria bacterium]|nr:N-acetylmuramoyl-L-alanine amidase [candidate division Zixibacteria bacterium]
IRLTDTRTGYVHRESVKLLAEGILPPRSRLSSFRSAYADNQLEIRASLLGRHPFSITEPDRRTLVLELFGVTMDTDWFRYDFKDPHIENASWTQPEPGLFRLELRFNTPLWGYRAEYQGSTFELSVRYPPENIHSLRGKRIVVDPGHSRDPGSIGPTGYTEAEANLGIALKLRDELARRGALVTLTRVDSSHVELYDRPKIADSANADLFVSVHNNALPDGANPFVNWGVSTYHYHTHSIELARAVHAEMLKLPNQRDHGFYHGNLAVCRPTERPSILVECGFMILPEQEAWLKTDFYRARVAKAIAQGVENFFKDFGREKP